LGSTTVIGSDKTGTLTENRMTVQKIWAGGKTFSLVDGAAGESASLLEQHKGAALAEHRPLHLTLVAGVLSNDADISLTAEGYETRGDPTEAALLIAAAQLGIEPSELRSAYSVDAEIPFEPERQYSASFRSRDDEHYLFVKGAPERLLSMCDKVLTDEGTLPLDREAVLAASQALASEGLRVLAMAYRILPHRPSASEDAPAPE
jgi:magnesium-transporting ATPase (P-type)